MSEIRKCPVCGEPRYQQGKGAHVETGKEECTKGPLLLARFFPLGPPRRR